MGTLNPDELKQVRQECAKTIPVTYSKPEINAVSQALEDWLSTNASTVSGIMDAALPGLSNQQKKKIVAEVLQLKWARDR